MKNRFWDIIGLCIGLVIILLIDYNRVTSCGFPEYHKCKSYLEHYGIK